jgi:hypothetical protein
MTMPLFDLLPGFHRSRDARNGAPLKTLLDVLETELAALRSNVGLLYDSWFIETCPDWAVAYIADLLGLDESLTGTDSPGLRALVANTMHYQRGRGTLTTLGHAATAVTGWPVLAGDLGARVVRTHSLRGPGGRTAGTLRLSGEAQPVGAAAMMRAHATTSLQGNAGRVQLNAEVTGPRPGTVALMVWRLRSQVLRGVEPRSLGEGRYTIHPMGIDAPLFTTPGRLPIAGPAPDPDDIPQPLTRLMLASLLVDQAPLPLSIQVLREGTWQALPPAHHGAADLSAWEVPSPLDIADVLIDPELGRLILGGPADAVRVDHAGGLADALGGGSYGRADRLVTPDDRTWTARVGGTAGTQARDDGRHWFATLAEAMAASPTDGTDILIEIADSRLHRLPAPARGDGRVAGLLDRSDPVTLTLRCKGLHVVIQAMDGCRPCLEGDLTIDAADQPGRVVLSGLWWHGRLTLRGELDLTLLDCTIWPAFGPAVVAPPSASTHRSLTLMQSITGPLRLPARNTLLGIHASVVDGRGGPAVAGSVNSIGGVAFGPAPVLDTATLFGALAVPRAPPLGDSLVTGRIISRHDPILPPAVAAFRSRRFGDPSYAALADNCPAEIARGAADGGELGVFHASRNRSRMEALAQVIDDYLPEGFSSQVRFMT